MSGLPTSRFHCHCFSHHHCLLHLSLNEHKNSGFDDVLFVSDEYTPRRRVGQSKTILLRSYLISNIHQLSSSKTPLQAPPEDLINEYACLGFWLLGEFPVARGDSIFLVVFISFWVPDYLFV